jgi:hypothetical protein
MLVYTSPWDDIPILPSVILENRLQLTAVDDGGLDGRADGAGGGAESLNLLHDLHGLLIGNLTEDDVLAIEPRGDNGGDEELGAVGVGTSVGHGEETGLVVLVDEVLIGELLTVDGATTSTVVAGEVTTLEHELGDDTVEGRALVTLTLGKLAELTEVLSSLGDVLLEEVEDDTARLGGAGAHGGVLDIKEGLGVSRHGCG